MTASTSTHHRPFVLGPVEMAKSWGHERWLNATRPEARALVRDEWGADLGTLAERIAAEPALLGDWTRRLFGDELPIFTKVIRADFPPFVHVGFNRAVERAELLRWLAGEQGRLRQLHGQLRIGSRAAFDAFMAVYAEWATAQAAAKWRRDDDATLAQRLQPFVAPEAELTQLLAELRGGRAALCEVLNEVDLRREQGNLLLTPAGLIHAIFGLSHQTHPRDRTRAPLEALYAELARMAAAGADDAALAARAAAADLPALRRSNAAPPKNEGWFPMLAGGRLVLVEPQQSSDTTYSLADFYTPFVWGDAGVRFRKGDPRVGLGSAELAAQVEDLDLGATSLDEIRHVPVPIARASHAQATLSRLVDDPTAWPFFTAHQLVLDGHANAAARWRGDHAPGVFQQLVVLEGAVELVDAGGGRATLSPTAPAFVPATASGGYELVATDAARLLLFSVPSPVGGFPAAE